MRYVPAEQLARALSELPEDSLVSSNAVGNLAIIDRESVYLGYIDIGEDCNVILFKESE